MNTALNNFRKKELINELEHQRNNMYVLSSLQGFKNPQVIKISQEIDKIITVFQLDKLKKEKNNNIDKL
ncbi:aspartyl-phosphate phosphatase Spo0E family protein [Bacillus sp. 1NLA3E]|uniref:aspartyl-phosphate phosphatase Spo0E family protein n=1 Tax=Bacillus sp. 1NLA3E TaxID=666686 RepID=UPI000247F169|nr:aspartyl-phosphate phosphatase Spo0E family protein [Bacillus sp. 1NLA3E]AGK54555.1 hypothetical protein B1NLA3E_14045 [Bacillus sp. 1NLA3E]